MRSAHAQDLFRGSEPEVEGDDSRVVVADGKRETRFFILKSHLYFKKMAQKMEDSSLPSITCDVTSCYSVPVCLCDRVMSLASPCYC